MKDSDRKRGTGKGKGGYQRSQFSNNVVGKNGTVMVAGVPHLSCKSCGGLQSDHGTSTHDGWAAAAKQGVPFVLPAGHPLAVAAATATGSTQPTLPSSAGTAATLPSTAGTAATAAPVGADAAGGSPGLSCSAFERYQAGNC